MHNLTNKESGITKCNATYTCVNKICVDTFKNINKEMALDLN